MTLSVSGSLGSKQSNFQNNWASSVWWAISWINQTAVSRTVISGYRQLFAKRTWRLIPAHYSLKQPADCPLRFRLPEESTKTNRFSSGLWLKQIRIGWDVPWQMTVEHGKVTTVQTFGKENTYFFRKVNFFHLCWGCLRAWRIGYFTDLAEDRIVALRVRRNNKIMIIQKEFQKIDPLVLVFSTEKNVGLLSIRCILPKKMFWFNPCIFGKNLIFRTFSKFHTCCTFSVAAIGFCQTSSHHHIEDAVSDQSKFPFTPSRRKPKKADNASAW